MKCDHVYYSQLFVHDPLNEQYANKQIPCSMAGDPQVKEHCLPKVVPQGQLNMAW